MSTAGQLVDRLYREYLYPPTDQPIQTTLLANMGAASSFLIFDRTALGAAELALLEVGTIVEVGQELMRSEGVNTNNSSQLDVTRGIMGTTVASHSTTDTLYVAPKFPRRQVFDAVCDSIINLSPRLWHTVTVPMTTSSSFVEIPVDNAFQVIRVLYESGGRWYEGGGQLLYDFPEVVTESAIQFSDVIPPSRAAYVTVKAKFNRPTSEATEVDDVERDWEQIVLIGALALITAGLDIDASTQDFITERLETQGFPVGSGERVSRAAVRMYEYLMADARRELSGRYPVPVSQGGFTYGGF